MKIKNLSIISVICTCLFAPALAQAGSYEEAVKQAEISINNAKAANYEWRDSRKFLEKADKLYKEGKVEKAMKLVKKAKMQGELAVAQAKLYSNINGPQ